MGTCLFELGPFVSLTGCKWGYLVFGQKETGAKRVAMATALRKNHFFYISSGAGHGTLGLLIIFQIQRVWAFPSPPPPPLWSAISCFPFDSLHNLG